MIGAEIYGSPEDPKDRKRMGPNPFRGFNLSVVDLTDGAMSFGRAGVNLTGANLNRISPGGAGNLDQAIADGAIFCGTIAPDGFIDRIDAICSAAVRTSGLCFSLVHAEERSVIARRLLLCDSPRYPIVVGP